MQLINRWKYHDRRNGIRESGAFSFVPSAGVQDISSRSLWLHGHEQHSEASKDAYKLLLRNSEQKRPRWHQKYGWESDSEVDNKEMVLEVVHWMTYCEHEESRRISWPPEIFR